VNATEHRTREIAKSGNFDGVTASGATGIDDIMRAPRSASTAEVGRSVLARRGNPPVQAREVRRWPSKLGSFRKKECAPPRLG
jgi:hypothetical protein